MSDNNEFMLVVRAFIAEVKPFLDGTFSDIFIEFEHEGKIYEFALMDKVAADDEIMDILHEAYLKRYDKLDIEEKKNLN